jgi:hypothetical protein
MLDRLYRVSGWDENEDVHALYTNDRGRAEEMRRQMEEDLQRVQLIGGHVVTIGISAWQDWEYYGTAEEAQERARDLKERGGTQICVEDTNGRFGPRRP